MSLVIRYRFDEPTELLATDSSGNSYTSTKGSGVVSVNDPVHGNVASFNRTNTSFVNGTSTVPTSIQSRNPRTVSYWVKRMGNSTWSREYVYGYGSSSNAYYSFFEYGKKMWMRGNTITTPNGTQYFNVGQWYHIIAAYQYPTQTTYVDSILRNTRTDKLVATNNRALKIGYGGEGLDGYLSDFRIYDYAMSATEVAALYAAGPNPGLGLRLVPRPISINAV